ncbi:MAG: GAF domain-containing protein [Armatimonadetes bacterium]|nr:GAF domain-containing protein [Armatimonadota bacterium]
MARPEMSHPHDRRTNPRLHRVLGIEIEHQGSLRKQFVVDLSATGFRVATEFPLTDPFRVCLHLSHGPVVEGTARAVWTEPLDLPGLFQSGCVFLDVSSVDQLQEMLTFIDRHLSVDQRSPAVLGLSERVALSGMGRGGADCLTMLVHIGELLSDPLSGGDLLERIVGLALEATGAERGFFLAPRDPGAEVVVSCGAERDAPISGSIVSAVLKAGVPLLSVDTLTDKRLVRSKSLRILGTRSILCVPLRSGPRTVGILYLDNPVPAGAFTSLELQLMTVLAQMAAVALESAEYRDRRS